MRGLLKKLIVVGAATSVAALAIPSIPAVATQNSSLTIDVGGHFGVGPRCNPETFKGCRDGESMRFQSPSLRVHQGDTLTFNFQGLHTATFLPEGSDVFNWLQTNTPGIASPYSVMKSDPDDWTPDGGSSEKPSVKTNPAVFDPTDPQCGAAANPCTYSGSLLNSGAPLTEGPFTFSAKVDADPGEIIWVMCLIHPHMFMKVSIVDDGAPTSTQADIDAARVANLAADEDWAEAQHAQLVDQQGSHVNAAGQKVYDVYVGVDNHRASINSMYPKVMTVPKGATVRFNFNELIYEQHNAALSFEQGLERGQEFLAAWCDEDGDAGAAADVPADLSAVPPCGDPSKLELDIPSPLWNIAGDGVFTGDADFENSGIRGGLQFSLAPWDVRFTKASKTAYRYFCMLHGVPMSGRIKVKG